MCCSAAVGSVGCQVAKVSPAVCHSLLLVTGLALRDAVESYAQSPCGPSQPFLTVYTLGLTQVPALRP
jgi:hypothetical protein